MAVKPQHVAITSPCTAKLDPNRGRDGAKSWYCGHCEKNVHVLSNMTETEARTLLADKVGQDLCVSYAIKADGTIRFQAPAPVVPISALRKRRTAATVAAAAGLTAALAACTPHEAEPRHAAIEFRDIAEVGQTERPTIPVAQEIEPQHVVVDPQPHVDDVQVEGGLKPEPTTPPEDPDVMVDGGLGEFVPPPPDPVPVPGGIRVAPLPPAETPDEPCDGATKTPTATPMARGGLRAMPVK